MFLARKILPKEPISRNGVRLMKGDTIKVIEHKCNCSGCKPLHENPLAIVRATQDQDTWLHANECKGGEEPLLRLQTLDGKTPACCHQACNVDFVYREEFEPSVRVNLYVHKQSTTVTKLPDESFAAYGARVADRAEELYKKIKTPNGL